MEELKIFEKFKLALEDNNKHKAAECIKKAFMKGHELLANDMLIDYRKLNNKEQL